MANLDDHNFWAWWAGKAAHVVQTYISENSTTNKTEITDGVIRYITSKKLVDVVQERFEGGRELLSYFGGKEKGKTLYQVCKELKKKEVKVYRLFIGDLSALGYVPLNG